ncbi:MAG: hypothetical protein ABMA64_24400 [Myxococcota bacterium]
MGDWDRALTDRERQLIDAAREKVRTLYEGKVTPHRSCGIAMAETFGLPTAPYQALRRGGITGCGECGVVVAGRLVLGQFFGDPDPTGAVTPPLRAAATEYEQRWSARIDRRGAPPEAVVCNALTQQFSAFGAPERASFCTSLAADVGELVAEVIVRNGGAFEVTPIG